ncbi:MAG: exodeoxyribonuclease VII small subunit [Clostridia bacterium]|nr:exodeoxyribonuclease VII small subunit [Clostridia bacterium]
MGFEKDIENLERIVAKLEQENLSIDEGLTLYAEAIKLGKKLVEEIKESKGKLELLNQDLSRINLEDCEVE